MTHPDQPIHGLVTLADIPDLSDARKPRSQITIARMGTYKDARYGTFQIDKTDFEGWQKNLGETFGNRIAVDFDHSSDRGRGTEAAAWIVGLERQGKDLVADVKWTPKGAAAVRDGAYAYFSPTFVNSYKNERGEDRGRALIGGALTNRPVLRELPTLSLSKDEFEGVATPAPPRDSRPRMDLDELKRQLSLPADADQVTVLAAVANLKPTTESSDAPADPAADRKAAKKARKLARRQQETDTRTLADGTTVVTMSAERLAELETRANAGACAATQLSEDRFQTAYEKALSEGRVAPSQEANLRELHKLDPELAVKTLDSFVRIVPTRPAGSGEAGASAGVAPTGVDPDRFQLHQEAKQLADARIAANPGLDSLEAYSLAAAEIEDRKFMAENGGF